MLKRAYFTASHPSSFGGKKKLSRGVKQSTVRSEPYTALGKIINNWLERRDTYMLYRPVRERFPRRKYIVNGIDDLWQIDLTDLTSLSTHNDGEKYYILFVIDVFTRKFFARVMKDHKLLQTSYNQKGELRITCNRIKVRNF